LSILNDCITAKNISNIKNKSNRKCKKREQIIEKWKEGAEDDERIVRPTLNEGKFILQRREKKIEEASNPREEPREELKPKEESKPKMKEH
jgi:hypothetical protein